MFSKAILSHNYFPITVIKTPGKDSLRKEGLHWPSGWGGRIVHHGRKVTEPGVRSGWSRRTRSQEAGVCSAHFPLFIQSGTPPLQRLSPHTGWGFLPKRPFEAVSSWKHPVPQPAGGKVRVCPTPSASRVCTPVSP